MGDDGAAWVHERFERGLVSLDDPYRPLAFGESSLSPQLLVGRDLFYTTNDARITSGGISCASWALSRWPLVQTPTLRGIGRTAPYFQDGRAASLQDVLVIAEGHMGAPQLLPPASREARVHYLKSL